MKTTRILTILPLVASLLLPTAHAKKGVGDKTNIKPSVIGGAPLKLSIYNFNSTPATGFWVTPDGILQSLPGAATIPPTGTTPITINSFQWATIFLQRPQGGGIWKHLSGPGPTAFIIAGTPPAGFKAGLKQNAAGPGGEVADDDGPAGKTSTEAGGKKKKSVSKTNVTTTTTTVTPPAAPVAAAKEPKKGKKATPAPLPPEGQELDVKAADLTKVTYKGPAKVQTLTQSGPKLWRSAGIAYDEVERDEFSVYLLRAKTDNERVVIDLHTRKVSFFTGSIDGDPTASYPILSASSGKP